ncbi:response regulator [Paenibacillus sp. LHD-117]|uniref:response regulator n=1 Tax=Paenibacillus sp. LHD-117 TaxID=3071412 RepID=UPI0027E01A6A|nr:response regulator [Paenibacillus sp. LHD-117]MDQ6422190.1 response regulator [Paenibacillus sp. LHD-117]
MKALIVDDEKHVRKTVLKLVDWEAFGFQTVLEAEDGSEAVALIQEHQPQLVITDMMMPMKSGIELMEWMEQNAVDCKKIVISGFNDFEFVRHTVKFGGIDYLLKPIDRKQLHDAVNKAVLSWKETNRERLQYQEKNIEVNEMRPMYRDKLLSRLLSDAAAGNAPAPGESYMREFPQLIGIRSCRVAVLDLNTLQQPIRDKYAASLDLLFFSLLNICSDFLQPAGRGIAFRNWNRPFEIVILLWDEPDTAPDWLRKIANGIERTLQSTVEFGLSTSGSVLSELHKSYTQASDALGKRNLLESGQRIHEYNPSSPWRIGTIRFGKHEEKIRLAVRSGNPDQIRHVLGEWFQAIGEMNHISMEQLKMWWDEFNAARAGWVEEFFLGYDGAQPQPTENRPFIVPLDASGRLSLPLLQQVFADSLIELSKMFVSMQTLSSNPMREIARYIEAHYTQDITLQDISARFHLNREYISRKFKSEFQETLIDYVNRIRVEKAKILLLNPHLRMTQIAQMIGYHDEKYFSRVFKKLTQMTPNDFRKEKMLKDGE